MNAPLPHVDFIRQPDAETLLSDLATRLTAGSIVPYLGAALAELAGSKAPVNPEALAAFFASKVALPRRAKGNAWASAQHIESNKHRSTVTALMSEAFAPPVAPTALHRALASLPLPMIVDCWYDGAMRAALGGRGDWGEVQGITRAGIGEDRWYRFYDAAGHEVDHAALQAAWRNHAGKEFHHFRRGLRRGADGDRHPDADSRHREAASCRPQLSVHRLPFQRPIVADVRPPDHQAFGGGALRDRRT
jgi:hypothetical protein